MNSFLTELFEYNHHYNQKLAELFVTRAEQCSEKSIQLFSHVLNAHEIWNARIEAKVPAVKVWDVHTVDVFLNMDKKNYEQTLRILQEYNLSDTLAYTNSQGQKFSNTIRDILFHVVNHSTYHRAQIATEFKQSGIEPLATDFIFYKRTN